MRIKFCGAAEEVTGSSHLITLEDGFTILLDCGLFQGHIVNIDNLNSKFKFNPKDIDLMILSHAHIDHCGRLPMLVKHGFKGKVISTHATRDLAAIMMMDTAHIMERDVQYYNDKLQEKKRKNSTYKGVKREVLYSAEDVARTMELFVSMSYDQLVKIEEGIYLLFTDTGHILGSASVNLRIKRGSDDLRLGFSGDIGRPDRPILKDPHPMLPADVVITESTYGDKLHLEKPDETNRFLEIISKTCVKQKGKVIIPAFSVGRTQEIVHKLDVLVNEKRLPRIKVYVDSPLSVNATDIFKSHPECFDYELHQYMIKDPDPFGFNSLRYVHDVEESKALNSSKEPCIIISASGMMNAGRIKHHVANNIEDSNNTILFVGYCSPETPGGILRNGAKVIKMFGDIKQVKANIEILDSFSAHGDKNEMLQFLENQRNTSLKTFLVHGDSEVIPIYKNFLQDHGFGNIFIPKLGEEVSI
ncbi:MAG: MBL fold metallo-hydrolase [Saprospiraceae bacterium]|nr:MBL fold metallo-hydrolase [Saprospiraceae bacterium]